MRRKIRSSAASSGWATTAPHTPAVIQRTIFENPGWYTAYTPYQAEISQGRMEALLNFQTMVCDLTGLEIANASMLDEGTAAAEAMMMCHRLKPGGGPRPRANFSFPSAATRRRSRSCGRGPSPWGSGWWSATTVAYAPARTASACWCSIPDTTGSVHDYAEFFAPRACGRSVLHRGADLLALTLLRPPGEFGADVAVGSAQRFGVPLGFGGPTRLPGDPRRLQAADAGPAGRRLQGRAGGIRAAARPGDPRAAHPAGQGHLEHLHRPGAPGRDGIDVRRLSRAGGAEAIARRVKAPDRRAGGGAAAAGATVNAEPVFDTLTVGKVAAERLHAAAAAKRINLRRMDDCTVGIALDETATEADVQTLLSCCGARAEEPAAAAGAGEFAAPLARRSDFLSHPVFNRCHTEHEMLRYIKRLEAKDLSLCQSMIALGSCTMKLNAASEMLPVSWPEFSRLHPFAPPEQARGYPGSSATWRIGSRRSPASRPSRSSPTRAPRANTPASSRSAPTMRPAARAGATSA